MFKENNRITATKIETLLTVRDFSLGGKICEQAFLVPQNAAFGFLQQDLKPGNLAVNQNCELKV